MRLIRGVLAAGVVMGLAVVGATSPADASLLMRLTSEGTVKTIPDGDGDGSLFYNSAVDGDLVSPFSSSPVFRNRTFQRARPWGA
jgi:hypothetical protein